MSEQTGAAQAQQMMRGQGMSSIKEALAGWGDVARLLRGGEQGAVVPVVIPKDSRGLRWVTLLWFALWALFSGIMLIASDHGGLGGVAIAVAVVSILLSALWWWRSSIVEIEEGTVGVLTKFGAISGPGLSPGRHYLWHPWARVAYVVDVTTEIPYAAPVLSSPTHENVPLKSIEFFLRFRIIDAIRFVQTIGAGNFDLVLSNSVQDAIRQRSRQVHTERAYDLRGSDVKDMQELLNRQLTRYGVQIMGCNIPDVQLPDQYREHLSTRERVSKELVAYEKEWELARKRRIDTLLMEIERSKKVRDAKIVEVSAALNKARKDVAQMLEERETEAQKVKYEIETRARTNLVAAQGEAKAQEQLATAYRDNRAVLEYELARRRLDVGAQLAESAPRPVIVHTDGQQGDSSALSTLLMAQLLPQIQSESTDRARRALRPGPSEGGQEQVVQQATQVAQQAAKAARGRGRQG
ncbi:SPFH domain-containing protein [Ornithinicoccus hortensis]|uniref:Regulator of protease activity HflC (Stomatin/prohibitin superfamily) n=1 Tax=Ornithinicoccus hortensis TaxID=82346 RepID=A0A542YNX1_9MICO|nr:SPFH domain-containing protein [Ornithinicoccus hortensis]TQL49747.1 regulator of protease activity HflC (stomatin/prohibitin superfamily) [Ornithinicoccus hortensis]